MAYASGCRCHGATFCPDLICIGYNNDVPIYVRRDSADGKAALAALRNPANWKFGDTLENGWASADNPCRRGLFVRVGNRTGNVNRGPFAELTDGEGKFWEVSLGADHRLSKV